MIRIILTGGGTGGHLFPLVAVARKIFELSKTGDYGEPEIYYLGPGLFLENSLEREEMNFHYTILITGKWRRYISFKNFIDLFKVFIGFIQALWKVWLVMPDVIFSKGGYGSVATVLAGWLYRIPIILHRRGNKRRVFCAAPTGKRTRSLAFNDKKTDDIGVRRLPRSSKDK